jgi:hypothetical protein
MICPRCREHYKWHETRCPNCQVDLVEHLPGESPEELNLVSVFHTSDAGLLPLAELALEGAHIEYLVRRAKTMLETAYRQPNTDFQTPVDPAEILVRAADAAQARDLLVDLENPAAVAASSLEPTPAEWEKTPVPNVQLIDAANGIAFGRITEEQFQQLQDRLEENDAHEDGYFISDSTIEMLEDAEVDRTVTSMLRTALGDREGLQVKWQREKE